MRIITILEECGTNQGDNFPVGAFSLISVKLV
jgi:hypothetical protein